MSDFLDYCEDKPETIIRVKKTSNNRWKAQQREYLLEINNSILNKIEDECIRANSVETGGILIGNYSDDLKTAFISDATKQPVDSSFGSTWFFRGVVGLKRILLKKWHNDERAYYIGEWHYHPAFNTKPSKTDISQMKKISNSVEYQCKEPILLIVARNSQLCLSMRIFIFPRNHDPVEFVSL